MPRRSGRCSRTRSCCTQDGGGESHAHARALFCPPKGAGLRRVGSVPCGREMVCAAPQPRGNERERAKRAGALHKSGAHEALRVPSPHHASSLEKAPENGLLERKCLDSRAEQCPHLRKVRTHRDAEIWIHLFPLALLPELCFGTACGAGRAAREGLASDATPAQPLSEDIAAPYKPTCSRSWVPFQGFGVRTPAARGWEKRARLPQMHPSRPPDVTSACTRWGR